MKKILTERFQQLAGIKSLYEQEQEKGEPYISARKLFDNIILGLKTSGPYADNMMYSKGEALEIMKIVIGIEEAEITPEAALAQAMEDGNNDKPKPHQFGLTGDQSDFGGNNPNR